MGVMPFGQKLLNTQCGLGRCAHKSSIMNYHPVLCHLFCPNFGNDIHADTWYRLIFSLLHYNSTQVFYLLAQTLRERKRVCPKMHRAG